MLNKLKQLMPWQLKIILKILLSRISLPRKLRSGLGVFKHGNMDEYKYAWSVVNNHLRASGKNHGVSAIEFGPGDGILSGLLAGYAGFERLDMLDAGDFASKDVPKYIASINAFLAENQPGVILDFSNLKTFEDLLLHANSRYFVNGLDSLISIPSESYDLVFSQAVLEHVRAHEFEDVISECYRILKPNGVMSHVIDFKDHLGGGLNNMRFGSVFWESDWFAFKSGFYTNRIRLSEFIQLCNKHNFRVKILSTTRFPKIPVPRNKLAPEFRALRDDDLMCSGAHLIMEKHE